MKNLTALLPLSLLSRKWVAVSPNEVDGARSLDLVLTRREGTFTMRRVGPNLDPTIFIAALALCSIGLYSLFRYASMSLWGGVFAGIVLFAVGSSLAVIAIAALGWKNEIEISSETLNGKKWDTIQSIYQRRVLGPGLLGAGASPLAPAKMLCRWNILVACTSDSNSGHNRSLEVVILELGAKGRADDLARLLLELRDASASDGLDEEQIELHLARYSPIFR